MAGKYPKTEFRVHFRESEEVVTTQQLDQLAGLYGIDKLIPGRYSHLFLVDLYLLEKNHGISPEMITQEIKTLEYGSYSYIKPPTEYTRKPLKGLWHKHFFPVMPSTVAHNLLNELGKNGIRQAAEAAFHPSKGDRVTSEMIAEFVDKVVEKPFELRSDRASLTGEWIVYAKYNRENYYLCIASHNHGDEAIAAKLKTVCCREFEWLSDIMEGEQKLSHVKVFPPTGASFE